MSNIVKINDTNLQVIEYRGQRVATLAQIDTVHGRPEGTARRNFNEHKHRLIGGEDFIEVTADEIRTQSLGDAFAPRTPKGILITEQGYTMLVKAFADDLAWQVQRQVVTGYFRSRESSALPVADIGAMLADPVALRTALLAYTEQVVVLQTAVADLAPKAAALEQISASKESLTMTQAAKVLGLKLDELSTFMKQKGWIYRQNGSWVAYEKHLRNGDLKYKEARYTDEETAQMTHRPYCHILPKGLTKLAEMLNSVETAA